MRHQHTFLKKALCEGGLGEYFQQKPLVSLIRDLDLADLDFKLVFEATTHRSFLNEIADWPFPDNERLEFLGDSVLGLWCTQRLFHTFGQASEGVLSRLKDSIVNAETLGDWGRYLNLPRLLLVGRGEFEQKLHKSDNLVADVFESLVGASFLGRGFSETCRLLDRWEARCPQNFFDLNRLNLFDPKSRLQEKTMAEHQVLPVYQAREVSGGFQVALKIKGRTLATVVSHSKKKAEKILAQRALTGNLLKKLNPR